MNEEAQSTYMRLLSAHGGPFMSPVRAMVHRSGESYERRSSADQLIESSSPSFLHVSSMNAKALTRSFSGRTLNALTASAQVISHNGGMSRH